MAGALEGIRVIDFGQYVAGPLTAMMLADNGADVIRVDPPGGPRWRHPANAVLQRGKRSIVLDLHDDADLRAARRLIASADVVVENFRAGVMERLGVGPRAMTEANRRLVYCSIPGFGEDDARAAIAGWEGVVTAAAGLYLPRFLGLSEVSEPLYTASPIASSYAAFIAAHSVLAALIARQRLGWGQRIEVPIFAAAFQVFGSTQMQDGAVLRSFAIPTPVVRVMGRHLCADGRYVDVSPPWRGIDLFAEHFVPKEMLDSGITRDPTPEAQAEVSRFLAGLFLTKTAAEWEQAAQEVGTGISVCLTSQEWLHDEHATASRCAISLTDPELGPTQQAGYPVTLSRTPAAARGARHALDSDRSAVLELAGGPGEGAGTADAPRLSRALEGFRVIDTSQVLAGPTACRILAEYGAEVIKINNPRAGENPGGTMSHTYVNNGKRSMLLDLKSADGHEVLRRLLEKADVFNQNFARGVAERLGVGEEQLRTVKPDIVYASINTHADGGFRAAYRGHEELGQALTGMETRYGGEGQPERANWPVCDYATGHLSAFAILLALFHRQRTGEGQHVQASLSQTGTYLQIPFMVDYRGATSEEPKGMKAKGWGPLYRLYQASDRWFFLAAHRPGDRPRLAAVQGLSDIDEAPESELENLLQARFAHEPAATWVTRLTAAGISAQPAADILDILVDADVERLGLTIVRDYEGLGELRSVGRSTRMSLTPLGPLFAAPPLGSHTREIVEEVGLGDRLPELIASGVVAVSV